MSRQVMPVQNRLVEPVNDLLGSRGEAVLPFKTGIFAAKPRMDSQLVCQPPLHSHSVASSPSCLVNCCGEFLIDVMSISVRFYVNDVS